MNSCQSYISLIILLLLCNCSTGLYNSSDYMKTNFQLNDIKNLTMSICQNDSDCPEYSYRCYYNKDIMIGFCDINVFCNEANGCIALKKSYKYSSDLSNMIFETFRSSNIDTNTFYACEKNTDCFSETCTNKTCIVDANHKCHNNEDCFSGVCDNGICITNDDDPIINCRPFYNDADYKRMDIICGKDAYQLCEKNIDCVTNNCNKEKLCSSWKESFEEIDNDYFHLILITGIVIFVVITAISGSE
ncbi:hypothetical protein PIROE2DRAFT_14745 [Piromyces sp. E2]|nr:hypothetical protein PIROE2DRAFT_14745 [Piromyces sp. E2]|eukprot:OUM59662.1 hypothetical protein PIROE2DRAFT_14745 [Piromyces sp. E2]